MSRKDTTKERLLTDEGELLPEYDIDYSKVRRNPFAARLDVKSVMVSLDPDVAEVFRTPEAVNKALRAFIEAMPQPVEEKKAA